MGAYIPASEQYEVVIVGAGPAGLMAATLLTRMGHRPLVIDSEGHASHEYGRSDAFQCRCMEVMQSLGQPIEQLEHMGKKLYGRTFWEISNATDSVRRTAFARFYPQFLDFDKDYSLAVRQGLIEQVMIHDIENHYEGGGFGVQWNWAFASMNLSEEDGGLSQVTIKNTKTGEERVVSTKYVIACDGARSAVRRWASPFGVKLEGESLPVTWCVLDAVGLKSDHPDLERLCIVRSSKGIVLVIPREPINGKPAARFDIQIEKSKEETTAEDATRMIREIFHPFTVEWDEVNWWSIYDVGQRIINQYSINNKIFFIGDACHTHSPRAGLGLNTALLEAHNLAWKLSFTLKNLAKPSILDTYARERHPVAKELIDMDRQLVTIYAGLEHHNVDDFASEETAAWLKKLQMFQAKNYAYQAGASIVYPSNVLTFPLTSHDAIEIGKPGICPGSRTRPGVVHRLSDSVPVPILPLFEGKFTIYILTGPLETEGTLSNLKSIDEYIRSSAVTSIYGKYGEYVNDSVGKSLLDLQPPLRIARTSRVKEDDPKDFPRGRVLYTYNYDIIPQITAEHITPTHTLFRTNIITTSSVSSSVVLDTLMPLLYPRASTIVSGKESKIFHPAHVYCDDVPVISPYNPEVILKHQVHEKWGVDLGKGAIVVARPDGHVGMMTDGFGVEGWKEVERYFEGIFVENSVY